MNDLLFAHQHGTRRPFRLPVRSFDTHYHLIGGTGKGKTTAIHTILHALILGVAYQPCVIIIDKLGNLSYELLLWMASPFCTETARRRLVYVEPSREDIVIPYNPLTYGTLADGYYKVAQAMEVILRGWANQNIEEMPRLARWLWNSFWAVAQLGLTIADCMHLVLPGSPHHRDLLLALPKQLQLEWAEILQARGGEAAKMLESTRNRLKPYFESPLLKYMFGASQSRLDLHHFMRAGKILVLNLAPYNRLPGQVADAIGGLVINEVLATARSLPMGVRYPTYLILDEFQNFVGPDLAAAIPEVRQLGIKMLFSHQGFSQLKRGDLDLREIIFQAQSRLVFGVQGEDANLLAEEWASLDFDAYRTKAEIFTRRQLLTGHKIIELQSRSFAEQQAQNWQHTIGAGWGKHASVSRHAQDEPVRGEGTNQSGQRSDGQGGSTGHTNTTSVGEHLVPVHETFEELASRTYFTFDEQLRQWAKHIRQLKRGEALLRLVDDDTLHQLDVIRSTPGHLAWDAAKLRRFYPQALAQLEALKERNFQSEYFVSPPMIEREMQERLQRVLHPPITLVRPSPEAKSQEAPANPLD